MYFSPSVPLKLRYLCFEASPLNKSIMSFFCSIYILQYRVFFFKNTTSGDVDISWKAICTTSAPYICIALCANQCFRLACSNVVISEDSRGAVTCVRTNNELDTQPMVVQERKKNKSVWHASISFPERYWSQTCERTYLKSSFIEKTMGKASE